MFAKDIKGAIKMFVEDIKDAINRMHCLLFDHKLSSKSIMAYSIDAKYMYAAIRIYKFSKCTRCGEIFCEKIDSYEKFGWYSQYLADEEEETLRKRGVISVAKAYQKLEKEG